MYLTLAMQFKQYGLYKDFTPQYGKTVKAAVLPVLMVTDSIVLTNRPIVLLCTELLA